ncbi:MAG: SurA N-terminal domain-containing protein [Armatimonadota bacterium]
MPKSSSIAFVALTALVLAGCGNKSSVATVNGDPISVSDWQEYLASKPKVQVMLNNQRVELPVADTLAFQAIKELVTQKVLIQLAQEEKLAPSQKDIDNEIAYRNQLDPNFIGELKNRGLTMSAIRNLVAIDICQYRLQTVGVKVTKEEVDKYIKDNAQKFVIPTTGDLAWILVSTDEKRAKVQRALDSGLDFKSAARDYSEAEGASLNDGAYSQRILSEMPPFVREKVGALKAGDKTDWLKSDSGYAKFQVIARTEEKPIEVTEARRELVKRQMELQRGSQSRDLAKQLAEKVRQANTKLTDESMQTMWKNYQARLKDSVSERGHSDPTLQGK